MEQDPRFAPLLPEIGRLGLSDEPVLIMGSVPPLPGRPRVTSFTLAERIHRASSRVGGPITMVACAALPETLLESELFGHEEGAFTSAIAQRKGRFEMAHKGTIFLDEIGEMTLATQRKLLRVLQDKEFERVGGSIPIRVDVRVIASVGRPPGEVAGVLLPDLRSAVGANHLVIPPP